MLAFSLSFIYSLSQFFFVCHKNLESNRSIKRNKNFQNTEITLLKIS